MSAAAADMSLSAIFLRFLRFGLLAWGGPVAQIGMIKQELVDEARWIDPSRFARLLAVYQLLPGPEAHELCVHLGTMKRGVVGGILAGLGFMLPGLVLVLGLAAIYRQLNLQDPLLAAAFLGVQIGVVALVVRALHRIADHVLGGAALWAIALVSLAGALLGVAFWLILPVAGIGYALLRAGRSGFAAAVLGGGIVLAVMTFAAPAPLRETATVLASAGTVPALALFLSGLKAGLLTFGGAYSAIPFVREDAVGRGWVEEGQFLDALALSGIIPAPLIIFATFVGFLAGGLPGALAMTAGIFLPAFTFGTVLHDQIERLVEEQRLRHLLEGVAAAVVGLIAATAVQLLAQVGGDLRSPVVGALIFAPALLLLYRWRSKLNVLAAVVASAVAGAAFLR